MVEQLGFSEEDEEIIAGLLNSARYLTKEIASLPTAIALALLGEGHKRLREASLYDRGEGTVLTAPDPNYFFNSLSPAIKQRALDGLGLVLVGSLGCAIESARGSCWDDNVYLSAFNEHIRGVPLSTISIGIKREARFAMSSAAAADDTVRIQAINTNGTAETIELLSNNRWRLPTIVQAHLSSFGDEIQTTVFRKAARIFVETSKRLKDPLAQPAIQPSAVTEGPNNEFTPERKSSFLKRIDKIIAGETKPLSQEVDDFLDKLS